MKVYSAGDAYQYLTDVHDLELSYTVFVRRVDEIAKSGLPNTGHLAGEGSGNPRQFTAVDLVALYAAFSGIKYQFLSTPQLFSGASLSIDNDWTVVSFKDGEWNEYYGHITPGQWVVWTTSPFPDLVKFVDYDLNDLYTHKTARASA